jgi:hypothetical protein
MDPILFLSRVLELQECPSSCSVSPFPSGERGNCTGQQDPQLVDEKHPTGSNEVAQSAVLKLASELLHHEPGFLEGAVEVRRLLGHFVYSFLTTGQTGVGQGASTSYHHATISTKPPLGERVSEPARRR